MIAFGIVNTTTARVIHAGNGAATTFPTDFVFRDTDTIKVTLVASDGTPTVQTEGTHYTVSGGDGSIGSVSMVTAPGTSTNLILERVEPYTQDLDLAGGDPFSAETVETRFDKNVMMIQQLVDLVSRAVLRSLTSEVGSAQVTLPDPEDGRYLVGRADLTGWDSTDLDNIVGVGSLALPVSVANGGTGQSNAAAILKGNYFASTGSANAYVVAPLPAPGAYAEGQSVRFQANHTADGPVTLDYGYGALAVVDAHGNALIYGGILSGGVYEVVNDGTNLKLVGHSRPIVLRLNRTRVSTASNTYATPLGADELGTTLIEVELIGGGGSGGGAASTSSNHAASSGGGGGGEYAYARLPSSVLGDPVSITIGAGGAAPTAGNNDGTAGGTTSFGSLLTAAGGGAGVGSPQRTTGGVSAGGAGGTGGAIGNISTGNAFHVTGSPGDAGVCVEGGSNGEAATTANGGRGGGAYGGGGGRGGSGANGGAGGTFGGGGGGCGRSGSGAALSGGAGGAGVCIIKEWVYRYA